MQISNFAYDSRSLVSDCLKETVIINIKLLFMQKIYISALVAATLFSTNLAAQKLTVLPSTADQAYAGLCISPNGKYVAGTDYFTYAGFVTDWQAGEFKTQDPIDEFGCEWRQVTDNGVAVGFNGPASTFDYNGEVKALEGGESTVGEGITADGSIVCGTSSPSSVTHAVIWRDGVIENLPEPTTEEAGFNVGGTYAKYISADGKLIVGYIVDDMSTFPLITWAWDDEAKAYKYNIVCKDYFNTGAEGDTKPYAMFMPMGVSANGKYIALTLYSESTGVNEVARYDVETATLTVAKLAAEGTAVVSGTSMVSSSIANDGTMIGFTGDMAGQLPRNGFIWKGGEESPKLLAEACPDIADLATFDLIGAHTPTGITPDGRYVVGFAADAEGNYKTYVLDLKTEGAGIESAVEGNGKADAVEVARYNMGGQKVGGNVKGLNIVKMSDGTVKKYIVK